MRCGEASLPWSGLVEQDKISLYAEAGGDRNPLHLDAEFCGGHPLRAHCGPRHAGAGLRIGDDGTGVRARLAGVRPAERALPSPVYPGDTVSTFGEVVDVAESDGGLRVKCSVGCRNQGGDEVINGDAWVTMPAGNGEIQ